MAVKKSELYSMLWDVFCQLEMHQNDKKNAAPKQSNFVNIRYEFLSYFHQGVL